ncbi:MAG: peroxide stress protein YaaA [Marmoricola sp.]
MLILLPPSEGKSAPTRGRPLALEALSFPELTETREAVLDALGVLCGTHHDPATPTQNEVLVEFAQRSLGLGPTQSEDVRRNAHLRTAATARADAIYTGVLYDNLDLASLDPAARRRASRWLAITSSLFGLVRPGDRIPSYRLAGGVNLPGLGVVSTRWREVLEPIVESAAGRGLVVDLRSTTYAAFWRPGPDLAARVATVRVLQQVGSQRKVVSHFNKATKGRLVRALLEAGAAPGTPGDLADVITGLGWKVELAEPSRSGQGLDVIVEDL